MIDEAKLWMLRAIRGLVVGTLLLLCSNGILKCVKKLEDEIDGR
jgi:hypothetical protein